MKSQDNPSDKIVRLWDFIEFTDAWKNCDTSNFDDISPSWLNKRKELLENSKEYEQFINRLKREHAIETGIVERLYDLKQGITETFIKDGFFQSYLSHGDTNIPEPKLMSHLNDHLDAVDFVFDVVKKDRQLSIGFVKELHALTTANQDSAEGRDQFGKYIPIPLIKGDFKNRENNPTAKDGTIIKYCPPDHVSAEMDNLIRIYSDLESEKIHPVIITAWFHHAFSIIHPFQDGNGRVARLLVSLIFIKHGYFPFTVLRKEAKVKYIEALELADQGQSQMLVSYFGEVQRRNIEKALNLKMVSNSTLTETAKIFSQRLEQWQEINRIEKKELLAANRLKIYDFCFEYLNNSKQELGKIINGNAQLFIKSAKPDEGDKNHYFYRQVVSYARKHDYFFNRSLPTAYVKFEIEISNLKKYQLVITIHHFGYDDSTLAISAFLEFKGDQVSMEDITTMPLELEPHVISIDQTVNMEARKPKIEAYLNNVLTITLAQIASELG